MTIIERIPTLSDTELAQLRENAQRMKASNNTRQQQEASAALPLIEAEQAARRAADPGKLPTDRSSRKRPISLGGGASVLPFA